MFEASLLLFVVCKSGATIIPWRKKLDIMHFPHSRNCVFRELSWNRLWPARNTPTGISHFTKLKSHRQYLNVNASVDDISRKHNFQWVFLRSLIVRCLVIKFERNLIFYWLIMSRYIQQCNTWTGRPGPLIVVQIAWQLKFILIVIDIGNSLYTC